MMQCQEKNVFSRFYDIPNNNEECEAIIRTMPPLNIGRSCVNIAPVIENAIGLYDGPDGWITRMDRSWKKFEELINLWGLEEGKDYTLEVLKGFTFIEGFEKDLKIYIVQMDLAVKCCMYVLNSINRGLN